MIKKKEELNYIDDNIFVIITGLPSVGKTTISCSLPNTIVADFDNGMKRVKYEHRKDVILVKKYDDFLKDLKDLKADKDNTFKNFIIDTGGSFIECLKDWATDQPGGMKKGGGISLQGFGIVKTEFARISRELRKDYNVIMIFHTLKEKDKDGNPIFDIQCEGATKQTVWQPADLGAYMQIINGDRYLCFSPTQEYSAKSSYGIKGMYKVPELNDGDENNFLEKLFEQVKANIRKEQTENNEKLEKYKEVMEVGLSYVYALSNCNEVVDVTNKIKELDHELTSFTELKSALKTHLDSLNIKYNAKTKEYEQIEK